MTHWQLSPKFSSTSLNYPLNLLPVGSTHADYRTVVDVGARDGGPHEGLEICKKKKKRRVPCLRDIIVSKLPRLERMYTPPVPDSASDVLALTRIDTLLLSQTCTIISIGTGDAAK